jgi:hypothetical protein
MTPKEMLTVGIIWGVFGGIFAAMGYFELFRPFFGNHPILFMVVFLLGCSLILWAKKDYAKKL